MSSLLLQPYKGPLRVIIHTLTGITHEMTPDLIPDDCILFDYLGHSIACLFTNMTTRLSVGVRAEDWEIVRFSAKEQILEVNQVSGEPLDYEPEDEDRFYEEFGYPDEILFPLISSN